MEEWEPIKGYEGLYEVSNLGRIKSLARKRGQVGVNWSRYGVDRILPGYMSQYGYKIIQLWKNNKVKLRNVHSYVLEAFKPKVEGKNCCNHKDGNKLNNNIDNLEWCTYKENNNHAFKIGLCDHRRGEVLHNAKLSNNQVVKIKRLLIQGKHKLQEIGDMFNVTKGCIWHIKHNRNWKHIEGVE